MVARGREGAQGRRGVGPGEQGVGRGEADRRRQQGQRGGRARRIGPAARRHARVTPEMLQQLLRRPESLAAVRGVPRDPVAHVGQLRAGGQGGELRVRVDGAGRAERPVRRDAAGFVIALGASGRTGARRRSRARYQFPVGDTSGDGGRHGSREQMRVQLAAGAVGIAAYRHQAGIRGSARRLEPRVPEIRIGGDETVLESGVMLRHERAGHHVDGQLIGTVAQVGGGRGR